MRQVVIVGAGGMGRAWMDAVARRDDLWVAAVVDIVPDAAQAAVRERGWDIPCTATVSEALRAVDAGMLLNVTVPEAHVEVSSAALRAGVPVLSEKPVAPTLAGALHLAAISDDTGTLLATSQSRRHARGIRALRDALDTLGGAEQLDARFRQNPRFGGFRDRMASPLLLDMAVHTFDQARYLLGSEPVTVWCEEYSPSWSWYRGAAAAHAVFRFNDGARFAYSGSWCADGLTTSWNGHWRGDAAGGAAEWDGEDHVVAQSGDAPPTVQPLDEAAEGLDAALAEFVGALDGGPAPSGEIAANVWSLAMVEAAVASSTMGTPVSLAAVFGAARAQVGAAR
ncbi:Gfo/Idh/MocA family oxidoreductase [Microbacterium sp. zg.Y1090]|uniref:Gfo/Idh/MocA family protein n=1 Tax=Microbacterium TaxID=33882 RepID=UPI00214B566B|nr:MULTISPECIES: Gfo/Idh/MocA family oxidoreductase [unclassified Microbacterium]MCR2812405.1 Gfo/Idh/MocA family oxidoreductase [Microbacterium sp. zg.Y1084]MCR2817794.1 Gfo/Idh/MocA family oxidoreductase [Microbacterium sp. zg.Y1090]MDL5485562.1 Gfo/Idh/MocA family oxidoreductase [Microbacterium sp. zg-Y1211]WIM28733.1 Gfo/Idh/MocA family oxidoreductase [Microbacterium sp. zg-Y1090]